jgi:hypothetical protein
LLVDDTYETPTGADESCPLALDGGVEGTAKVNAAATTGTQLHSTKGARKRAMFIALTVRDLLYPLFRTVQTLYMYTSILLASKIGSRLRSSGTNPTGNFPRTSSIRIPPSHQLIYIMNVGNCHSFRRVISTIQLLEDYFLLHMIVARIPHPADNLFCIRSVKPYCYQ